MKTILVPTDFSKNALYALDVAYQIALKTDSEIHLLNVCQLNDYGGTVLGAGFNASITANYIEQVKESVENALTAITTLEKYAQVPIRAIIEFGGLVSQINTTAARIEASLVVMGTKGASGLNELLLGSNTEQLIRTSKCPVLAVPYSEVLFELKNVVFPTTLAPNQAIVCKELGIWQSFFDFEVHVLHINNPQNYVENDTTSEKAQEFIAKSGLKNHQFYTLADFSEEKAIFEFAEQRKANMIVMGTNQRRGLAHFFLGSLTEDVTNHSHLPILSISLRPN